jgi:glycosyltransferase A (GT-A) superfamily protein (DUF2064 family)
MANNNNNLTAATFFLITSTIILTSCLLLIIKQRSQIIYSKHNDKIITNNNPSSLLVLLPTALIIVAKFPQPGYVKTRLAMKLKTPTLAADFARASLLDLLERLDEEFSDESIILQKVILFTPSHTKSEFLQLLIENHLQHWQLIPFVTQTSTTNKNSSNLSYGLTQALTTISSCKIHIFLGSDTPHINIQHVKTSISALEEMGPNSASIIPAQDGGYVFLGLREISLPNEIFNPNIITWSSDKTCITQLAALSHAKVEKINISTYMERDVDEIEDLYWLKEQFMNNNNNTGELKLNRIRTFFGEHLL